MATWSCSCHFSCPRANEEGGGTGLFTLRRTWWERVGVRGDVVLLNSLLSQNTIGRLVMEVMQDELTENIGEFFLKTYIVIKNMS